MTITKDGKPRYRNSGKYIDEMSLNIHDVEMNSVGVNLHMDIAQFDCKI